jgi:uncharacterized repeat protein (TIGR04076 family)
MTKCKITVLRRSYDKGLADEYINPELRKNHGPCERFRDGQEFVTDVFGGVPEGFCPWAWDDLYKALVGFAANGHYGMWYRDAKTLIGCCSDGIRPVIFKVEKLEEGS